MLPTQTCLPSSAGSCGSFAGIRHRQSFGHIAKLQHDSPHKLHSFSWYWYNQQHYHHCCCCCSNSSSVVLSSRPTGQAGKRSPATQPADWTRWGSASTLPAWIASPCGPRFSVADKAKLEPVTWGPSPYTRYSRNSRNGTQTGYDTYERRLTTGSNTHILGTWLVDDGTNTDLRLGGLVVLNVILALSFAKRERELSNWPSAKEMVPLRVVNGAGRVNGDFE